MFRCRCGLLFLFEKELLEHQKKHKRRKIAEMENERKLAQSTLITEEKIVVN